MPALPGLKTAGPHEITCQYFKSLLDYLSNLQKFKGAMPNAPHLLADQNQNGRNKNGKTTLKKPRKYFTFQRFSRRK
jgi:hypothetical protein